MRQGVLISTTEHLLSVFYYMGIDNAYVEIDNLEVPILDGSGLPFVDLIRTGRHPAATAASAATCASGGRFRSKTSGKRISILPAESFRLTCDTDYPAPVGRRQSLEMEVTPERYAAEIALARTFGCEGDLDQMRNMGLIRGASLENAVCFTATRRAESRRDARSRTSAAATKRWT